MSEQVGRKTIDLVLISFTLMLFVAFPVLFYTGLIPIPQNSIWSWTHPSSVLWSTTAGMWLLVFCIFLASRVQPRRDGTDEVDERGREFQAHPSSIISGSSFVIPSYCPYCSEPIILEDIHWIQSDEFACHDCQSIIRVTIKEEK